jgi:seryl-tRNA synthetase
MTGDVDAERVAFREMLISSGLLVRTSVDGLYHRSAAFERIVGGVRDLASRSAEGGGGPSLFFSPVMPAVDLEKTGYLRSFPDLLGAIEVFRGGDAQHAQMLAALAEGGEWAPFFEPAEVAMAAAACHPLYASLTGVLPAGGVRYEIEGHCFRHEPSIDPGRMQTFRQHEFVYVGDPEVAREHRATWVDRAQRLFESIGLTVAVEVANDPFFGRVGRMLAANQRETSLKLEITAPVGSTVALTAIASANLHESHFGEAFDIHTSDGQVAHSTCIGFGLERIALALVRVHGPAVDEWPAAVASRLWG